MLGLARMRRVRVLEERVERYQGLWDAAMLEAAVWRLRCESAETRAETTNA